MTLHSADRHRVVSTGRSTATILWLLATVALVTGLNAVKPMRVDDAAYYSNAAQFARHPADPYGFVAFWTQHPVPANRLLCPPVLPFWWSLGMRLFGPTAVVGWKLWLFPWLAALVFAVHALARRLAPAVAVPLAAAVALSPAVLPAVNLMLDVPALAAGLTGLCLGLSAVDRRSVPLALAAGAVFAVAMQTKYTAVTFPAAVGVYALLGHRGWRAVAVAAVALFVAWEAYIAHRYGASHFLTNLRETDAEGRPSLWLRTASLVLLVGSLAPAVGLAALVALGVRPAALATAAAAVVAIYVAQWFTAVPPGAFFVLGLGVWGAVLACGRPLWRRADTADRRRDAVFLFAWLAVEVAATFAMAPFPAARRVMAVTVVMTLIVGRALTSDATPSGHGRRSRWMAAVWAGGIALGLAFAAVDILGARAEVRAVRSAAAVVNRQRVAGQTVWFTGHWGVQFYGPLAGFRPILPDRSRVHRGDWVVLALYGLAAQQVDLPPADVTTVANVTVSDGVPLTTSPYYGFALPLLHRTRPRVWLRVYRATAEFVPTSTRG